MDFTFGLVTGLSGVFIWYVRREQSRNDIRKKYVKVKLKKEEIKEVDPLEGNPYKEKEKLNKTTTNINVS